MATMRAWDRGLRPSHHRIRHELYSARRRADNERVEAWPSDARYGRPDRWSIALLARIVKSRTDFVASEILRIGQPKSGTGQPERVVGYHLRHDETGKTVAKDRPTCPTPPARLPVLRSVAACDFGWQQPDVSRRGACSDLGGHN